MSMEQIFKGAGQKDGLQVWRIEKGSLNPVPKEQHGNFFSGDSYIVLHTAGKAHNVHSWAGSESSQDEFGSAAILMTQLDDFLGGTPCQYTEFQGEESVTFQSYFKPAIKYKQGGVASGFNHVVTNDVDVQRLMHVKGRRFIRATEVPMSWNSFNSGDCFIIDLGKNIYHWSGTNCNRFEALKTTHLALDIRDNERCGRGEMHRINEGSEPEEVISILGPKPDLPAGCPESDASVSRKSKCVATLYKISDAAGSMETTLVAQKNPFQQAMLSQSDCYILDNGGDRKIFVWKGKDANPEERRAARAIADNFIKEHNYPSHTQIQIIAAGGESTLFKDFFFNWLDKDETTGPSQVHTSKGIAKVKKVPFNASKLHENKAMAAQHAMIDDGSGDVKIWRVEDNGQVPVDPSTYGQFYGGDCYLVKYSYKCGSQTRHIIYYWQGNKCSKNELGASAVLAVEMDKCMGGVANLVRVCQGEEPAHLVSLFKDKPLVVFLGGTSRGGQTAAGKTRLFHIRKSSTNATRAVEVQPTASSLNTNDVFVLKTPNNIYQWKGVGAAKVEMEAAKYTASLLGGNVTEVAEKSEPDAFWAALGGKGDYQTSQSLQQSCRSPRLFTCSNATGNLIVEEVPGELTQLDLETDDIMILDVGDMIYIWIGETANEDEKNGVQEIAQQYIASDPSGRHRIPIVTMNQGNELSCFTGWFQAWDSKFWDKDPWLIFQ
ncbi:unnamed protein product [Knipowitschia caucasica]